MSRSLAADALVRARIPADLDTPDRVVMGLTVRQAAILAAAAVPIYLAWHLLADRLPLPVLAAATAPLAAVATAVAVGRRDGISLDAWLLAAITHRRTPRRLVPVAPTRDAAPSWAPAHTPATTTGRLGVLRLPASDIDGDGVLSLGSSAVALVAASTITSNLNTGAEQAAQVAAYGRWLNALPGPVQIVVSARRVDLGERAVRIADASHALPHEALATAAVDHAWFLLDLADAHDPLERTITIACTATTPTPTGDRRTSPRVAIAREAHRRAAATAQALADIGSRCRVLDAAEATAVLTAATDPFTATDPRTPRTPPTTPVTAPDTSWDDDATTDRLEEEDPW